MSHPHDNFYQVTRSFACWWKKKEANYLAGLNINQENKLEHQRRFYCWTMSICRIPISISGHTHFQSLDMKYWSSNRRCSQSSTIFSVYRCSIRHERILHTDTHRHTSAWTGVYQGIRRMKKRQILKADVLLLQVSLAVLSPFHQISVNIYMWCLWDKHMLGFFLGGDQTPISQVKVLRLSYHRTASYLRRGYFQSFMLQFLKPKSRSQRRCRSLSSL